MPPEVAKVEWRLVVCDLTGAAITTVDGIATNKQLTFRLNRPATCTFTVPADDPRVNTLHTDSEPFVSCSNRVVKAYRLEGTSYVLRFAGPIMQLEDSGDAERSSTAVTAFSPHQLLYSRLARFTTSSGGTAGNLGTVTYTTIAGNLIAKEQVDQTVTTSGTVRIQTTGTFATTSTQTVTFEEGYTIGQALETLTDTRTMDVLFDPVDNVSGVFATMGVSAARGSAKPDAVFGYGTANFAVAKVSRLLDGTDMANDVKDAGGRPTGTANWPTGSASDSTSITKYGRYESWRVVDPDIRDTTLLGTLATGELALRKNPREYLTITPFPERGPSPFTDWDLGDTIQVWTASTLRQAVTGSQRVYGFTINVADNGYESVGEIVARAE